MLPQLFLAYWKWWEQGGKNEEEKRIYSSGTDSGAGNTGSTISNHI